MNRIVQENIPYEYNAQIVPASLYKYIKIKNLSDNKEIKYLQSIKDIETKTNNNKKFVEETFKISVTGGFTRNLMLNFNDPNTDIDMVYNYQNTCDCFDKYFKKGEKHATVKEYIYKKTKIHLIRKPYTVFKSNSSLVQHVFVDPLFFDFTINLGCISLTDNNLYAPPTTLTDIQNRIVRTTLQLSEKNILFLLNQSLALRGIRFAIKYDMSIHDYLYKAIKLLFQIQRDYKTIDDLTNYYTLKHIITEPEPLKQEIYSVIKKLKMYEIENFPNLDSYFNYVKNRVETENCRKNYVLPYGSCFTY